MYLVALTLNKRAAVTIIFFRIILNIPTKSIKNVYSLLLKRPFKFLKAVAVAALILPSNIYRTIGEKLEFPNAK